MSHPPDLFIEDASDRCVLCGMCIPQCPSYQLQHSENESPRGRISLLRAVNQGQLEVDRHLLISLNHCLGCGRCESLCPSQVPYLQLLDKGRDQLWQHQSLAWRIKQRTLIWLLGHPQRLRALLRLASLPLLRRVMPRLIRRNEKSIRQSIPVQAGQAKGQTVLLLRGCANQAFDPALQTAAASILKTLGYRVETLTAESCCGALAQHSGKGDIAHEQARALVSRAAQHPLAAILHPASACSQHLKAYGELFNDSNASNFSVRSEDLSSFILRQAWPADWPFRQQSLKVLLHIPCSQQADGRRLHSFLKSLPGLEVDLLPSGTGCCGAAGSYMLNFPQQAARLRQQMLGEADQYQGYDYLVSGNIGCQIHLQAGLEHLEVIHPLMLIYRHSEF